MRKAYFKLLIFSLLFFSSASLVNAQTITGSGTTNYIPKFTSATSIGDTILFDNGNLAVGHTNPTAKLDVGGSGKFSSVLDVLGNFNVNTNKFTVAAASGNTSIAGTLGVTGLITASGGISASGTSFFGPTTISGTLNMGNQSINNAYALNGVSGQMFYIGNGGSGGIGFDLNNGSTGPVNFFDGGPNVLMSIRKNGFVGIGTTSPAYALDVQKTGGGRFKCSANFANSSGQTTCSDVAEVYDTEQDLEAGDVLAVSKDYDNKVEKTSDLYQDNIVGVYSTSPGLLIGGDAIVGAENKLPKGKVPVALIGRAPVKISSNSLQIKKGDYLTSSSDTGKAMKATEPGQIVGKALEDWSLASGKSKILMFVNVSFADPEHILSKIYKEYQNRH